MEGKHSRWRSQPRPCDLLRKIRGPRQFIYCKPIRNQFLQVDDNLQFLIYFFVKFFWSAELTRAIVEDLSNGRSPEILIDRFRNYCTKPDSNWLNAKLTFSILVDRSDFPGFSQQPNKHHRVLNMFSILFFFGCDIPGKLIIISQIGQ